MRGHKDAIYDFVLDEDRKKVYSAGADGYVVEWNLSDPENGNLVLQTQDAIYSVGLAENGLRIGTQKGDVLNVDLKAKKLLSTNRVHNGGIFITQSNRSGGEDGILVTSDMLTGIRVSTKSLRCLVETADYLYIGASDSMIYKLDRNTYELLA
ncbi:MAG: hypothetical protein ACPGYY_05760, partial [Bacteroidia bacterium]